MSGIGDAFSSAMGSVTNWVGDKLKQGAGWTTRQVVDGVKTSFGGAASPESGNGFEPGAAMGKLFSDNTNGFGIAGGILGAILGWNFGADGLKGSIISVAIGAIVTGLLGNWLGNKFKSATAHDANAPSHEVPLNRPLNLASQGNGNQHLTPEPAI